MKQPKLRFKADDGSSFPDWEKNNFSDVFDSINNSTFSRDCLNYVDGNVKYIHYGDILTIFDSTVNVEAADVPYVNKDIDCQKYQFLADGDIIVADTAEDDTVGKAVEIVNASNVKVISGLHTIACRPKSKFTSGYLGYYMNSNPYHNQLHPYMQGIKVTSISKANIALTNISVPSLPEQRKIASLFVELDNLIQSAEKELEGYRELKQGMLQKMFPKKGEKVPEIRFPEFTGDWEQRKLAEITKTTIGEFVIKTKQSDSYPYPVFNGGVSNTGFYCDFNNEGNKILVSARGANAGYVNIVKTRYWAGNSCYSVDLINKNEFNTDFVYQEMKRNQTRFTQNQQAANIPSVSKADVENFAIDVPSYDEQVKIAKYFNNIDHLIAIHQRELDGYKELKKGLLQQMFC